MISVSMLATTMVQMNLLKYDMNAYLLAVCGSIGCIYGIYKFYP
jgi:hypothetical protein